jgi:hypothetical protein
VPSPRAVQCVVCAEAQFHLTQLRSVQYRSVLLVVVLRLSMVLVLVLLQRVGARQPFAHQTIAAVLCGRVHWRSETDTVMPLHRSALTVVCVRIRRR